MAKSALRITAMNDAAARLGLTIGMALADARARHPAIEAAEANPEADRRLLEAIADWCDRYTPLVALDAPSGVMLDVTGCAHLFGGEAALGRDIVARLAAQGFHARAAVADTPGCAWAVARHGVFKERNVFIVPPSTMREALAPLPLAALRLDPDTVAALADVGLKRIADVLDLPRAALAARFGEAFLRRLDQALGREDEPITPRRPAPCYMAEQHFAEPIARERDVLGAIGRLSIRLGYAMEARDEGARLLEAALFRTDGKVFRIAVGTGAPVRAAERIARLFKDRLATVGEACDPGFGYDLVRLSAPVTERCAPAQAGLDADPAACDHAAELGHLIDRLGARFGLRRITRLAPQDAHIPEFAVAAVPAHAAQPQTTPPPLGIASSPAVRGRGTVRRTVEGATRLQSLLRPLHHAAHGPPSPIHGRGCAVQDTLAPARPARLFARPERIEAIAEVPDGPPVRFRWRRALHEVAAAEGPERIALAWWRDAEGRTLTRDYFRVETRTGARVWLYREGLYVRETAQPRWFLHGLFG
jgi:protein ImuB